MITLQELITRGRYIFSDSPGKLDVFKLVNGKLNTFEIAEKLDRHINSIRRDLKSINNTGLIQPVFKNGEEVKKDNFPVFEIIPLAREIQYTFFQGPSKIPKINRKELETSKSKRTKKQHILPVPTPQDIMDIAKYGENQIFEFKAQGTDIKKITKEIGAMLNTEKGGIIFYGIDDDGIIEGTDISRQDFDQPLQNSVKDNISPAAVVHLHSIDVYKAIILVIIVPPWNKKDVFQHRNKTLLRKGTNAFAAKTEEIKLLHRGKTII